MESSGDGEADKSSKNELRSAVQALDNLNLML